MNSDARPFGIIRDLSATEQTIRRELAIVRKNLTVLSHMVEDGLFDAELMSVKSRMLIVESLSSIKAVIGD